MRWHTCKNVKIGKPLKDQTSIRPLTQNIVNSNINSGTAVEMKYQDVTKLPEL